MRVFVQQLMRAITTNLAMQRRTIKCNNNKKQDPTCRKRALCKKVKKDPCELLPDCPRPNPCEILKKDAKKRFQRRKKFLKDDA